MNEEMDKKAQEGFLPDEALEGVAGGAVRDTNHYCVHCGSVQNCHWARVGTSYGWICSRCANPADWKDGKEVGNPFS